jgi:CheY-like chemotaxis protein
MDLKMPGLSGLDATRELKRLFPGIFVIAQTAYALPEERKEALEAGCDDYLAKPIRKEELLRVLTRFCGKGLTKA